MLYIFETKLPENKSLNIALQSIYGIGPYKAKLLCQKLGFSANLKTKNVTRSQINELLRLIDSLNILIADELQKAKVSHFKALVSIKAYKGLRRLAGLPVRGQRTHTNSKSCRKIKISWYEQSIRY